MGKKTPKAPVAPDPAKTAAAQTQSNKETAIANANLNRINQYTPDGSLTFTQIGTNADGTPKYQSNQTYSPEQQALYDSQTQQSLNLSNLANSNIGRVSDAQSQPFSYDGMTPIATGIPGGSIATGYDAGGGVKSGFDAGGAINNSYASGGNIQNSYASGGDIQKQIDFSKLSAIPGTGDYGAEAKRAQDAVYNQATSRLDPQYEQQQRQLASTLAGKGVTENSAAYRNAMDQFARNKTDAYNQATYSSIGAGGQEQSRLFGLALSGRQQGASEVQAAGGFANAAQAQAEAQNAARAGFGNEAQNQAEMQNAARALYGNQSQQQQYEQNQGQAQFANQSQAQQNAQNAAAAAFGNTAQGQQFNQNASNATFNNQARQQQIQEALALRNQPLNEVAALMGQAGGVKTPQFEDYSNANVANTDYAGIIQNNFNNQQAIYQQQMAARNAGLGAIFGAVGGLGSAAMMASDRRLKHNIVPVGELPSGIKTYAYSYLGSDMRQFGVMADEVIKVIPDAVIANDNGYMAVDYGKVWSWAG